MHIAGELLDRLCDAKDERRPWIMAGVALAPLIGIVAVFV